MEDRVLKKIRQELKNREQGTGIRICSSMHLHLRTVLNSQLKLPSVSYRQDRLKKEQGWPKRRWNGPCQGAQEAEARADEAQAQVEHGRNGWLSLLKTFFPL
ncbi:hypothetical protein ISCGN_019131 [Ixodes scapularis]